MASSLLSLVLMDVSKKLSDTMLQLEVSLEDMVLAVEDNEDAEGQVVVAVVVGENADANAK